MQKLERCVVIMCSNGCGLVKVNEARHRLFTSCKKTLENIPHSQAALFEHVKRDVRLPAFTGSKQPQFIKNSLLSGSAGGKTITIVFWLPYWKTVEDARKACSILLHCSCEMS